ncbi:unnamed protein product, partial [Symbiodinium pilosum]
APHDPDRQQSCSLLPLQFLAFCRTRPSAWPTCMVFRYLAVCCSADACCKAARAAFRKLAAMEDILEIRGSVDFICMCTGTSDPANHRCQHRQTAERRTISD